MYTGKRGSSGVLSFLRGAGGTKEPSPKLSRKAEQGGGVEAVRYTPRIDWDSLEGTIATFVNMRDLVQRSRVYFMRPC